MIGKRCSPRSSARWKRRRRTRLPSTSFRWFDGSWCAVRGAAPRTSEPPNHRTPEPPTLLLFYPISPRLQHGEQPLRTDDVRGADHDEAGRRALQAGLELRHPVAVAFGDE